MAVQTKPIEAGLGSASLPVVQDNATRSSLFKDVLLKVVESVLTKSSLGEKEPSKPSSQKLESVEPAPVPSKPASDAFDPARSTVAVVKPLPSSLGDDRSKAQPIEVPSSPAMDPSTEEDDELVIALDDSDPIDNDLETQAVTDSPPEVVAQPSPIDKPSRERHKNTKAITDVLLSKVQTPVTNPLPTAEPILVASAADIVSPTSALVPLTTTHLPAAPSSARLVAQEEQEQEEDDQED